MKRILSEQFRERTAKTIKQKPRQNTTEKHKTNADPQNATEKHKTNADPKKQKFPPENLFQTATLRKEELQEGKHLMILGFQERHATSSWYA